MSAAVRVVRPQPGPQEMFAACPADIALFGGGGGGGKSWASCFEAGRWVDIPGYNAIIFRRESTSIRGGEGVWEESKRLYPPLGGVPRDHNLDWRFPSGALIEFRHLQHESDLESHKSKAYALIIFEELTEFTEKQFWYMLSRNRSRCGVQPYVRATFNPDPDHFSRRLVDWWIDRDGYVIPERSSVVRWFVRLSDDSLEWADTRDELVARHGPDSQPLSFTFIPSKLADNPAMDKADPKYRAKLMALSRVDRERLLGDSVRGPNFNIRPTAGSYFRRSWFKVVDAAPVNIERRVRAWDKAATEPTPQNPEPAWTVGIKVSKTAQGVYYIEHAERFREGPGGNERRIRSTAELDGKDVAVAMWQDPGQAGKSDAANFVKLLDGWDVETRPTSADKETFAKPMSAQAEAGNVVLVRGEWNEPFLRVLESFPAGKFKDDVDALSLAHQVLSGEAREPIVLA